MTSERFAEFFDKYQRGALSAEDRQELDEWIAQSEFNRETFERITNEDTLKQALNEEAKARRNNWEKIVKEYPELAYESAPVVAMYKERFGRIRRYVVVAASLLVIALAGAYLWLGPVNKQPEEIVVTPKEIKNDVLPDTKNAVLTLDDGTTIILDSAQNGMLATEGGMNVVKKANGQLVYEAGSSPLGEAGVRYNTITVPKGSDVVFLTLADGSKVWMNAASSIRYPTTFESNERKVEITGEAYFEVASSVNLSKKGALRPFIVEVNDMAVEVMGTHFNINSYSEESEIKTTLLEGRVRISKGTSNVVLVSGQQASLNKLSHQLNKIDNVDVDAAVAWRFGYFQFNEANLQTVLRQLVRWYDVEVIYQGSLPQRAFWGKISRSNSLAQVLKTLETNEVHFKIEGKKIIVSL